MKHVSCVPVVDRTTEPDHAARRAPILQFPSSIDSALLSEAKPRK